MFRVMHFLGSLLIFIGFASMVMGTDALKLFPEPFGELMLKYKWLLLVGGIIFSSYGFIAMRNELRMRREEPAEKIGSRVVKKNFIAAKQQDQVLNSIKSKDIEKKELALKVDWTPLSPGGANFKTSKLVQTNPSRLEIVKSSGAYLFSGFFILMGLGIPGFISYSIFNDKGLSWEVFFPLLIGSIFVIVGALMLYFPRPRVFDKQRGWFWAGSKSLNNESDFMQLKRSARLTDIEAIQILSEYVSGNKSSYTSWEINLVSADAKRLNVLDHGNKNSVLGDAQIIGDFLNVPVWENG